MQTGKVKWFNAEKGYGFIGENIFVHAKELKKAGIRELNPGDEVSFEKIDAERGPVAINVKMVQRAIAPKPIQRHD